MKTQKELHILLQPSFRYSTSEVLKLVAMPRVPCLHLVKTSLVLQTLSIALKRTEGTNENVSATGYRLSPQAKMHLKIHRVSILALEQSKIPRSKAILMYTVPEV